MKIIRFYDYFLIDQVFQHVTEFIQQLIGINCFKLGKALLWLAAFGQLGALICKPYLGFFSCVMTTIIMWAIRKVRQAEKQMLVSQSLIINPLIIDRVFTETRLMAQGIAVVLLFATLSITDMKLGQWFFLMSFQAHFLGVYASSCTPLLPRKSKLRQMLEFSKTARLRKHGIS